MRGARLFSIPDLPTNSVLVDPKAPSVLFVAADYGVYASIDSGAHWFRIDFNLPHSEIYCCSTTRPPTASLPPPMVAACGNSDCQAATTTRLRGS